VIIYICWHLLVIVSRFTNPDVDRPLRLPLVVPIIGAAGTVFALYYAFQGQHGMYGNARQLAQSCRDSVTAHDRPRK
jgi:hypothetical protein